MAITIIITNITQQPCGQHINIALTVNGVARTFATHRDIYKADAMDDFIDDNREMVLGLFIRHFVREYLATNPSATAAQIRTNLIGKTVYL